MPGQQLICGTSIIQLKNVAPAPTSPKDSEVTHGDCLHFENHICCDIQIGQVMEKYV